MAISKNSAWLFGALKELGAEKEEEVMEEKKIPEGAFSEGLKRKKEKEMVNPKEEIIKALEPSTEELVFSMEGLEELIERVKAWRNMG